MVSPAWALLRTAAAGGFLGCTVYASVDVLGDYTTYSILRDQALALAADSEELKTQIGQPFTHGPWYNASIGFTGSGNVVACTFQLLGAKQITDVTVRAVRKADMVPNVWYNLMGAADWRIMDCNAMFPAGGGMARPRSLMPAHAPMPMTADIMPTAPTSNGKPLECVSCNNTENAPAVKK